MKIAWIIATIGMLSLAACAGGETGSTPEPEGEPGATPESEPDPVDNTTLPCVVEEYNAEDTLTSTTTYTFVRQGIGSFLFDYANPAVDDQETTYSYDASGRLYLIETDQGLDGTIETTIEYVWAGGLVATSTTTTAIGTQSQTTYTYENDLVVRTEVDTNVDGSIDSATDYVRDAEGRVIRFESDFDGDGSVDFVSARSFQVDGNLTTERVDNGDDGSIDNELRTTVNDAGATILYEDENFAANPPLLTSIAYTLDDRNRAIRAETTRDGALTSYTLSDYSCHP